MAKEFFKDLPNTTTPLTASRLNGLLDGEEAMGNLVVDGIKTRNMLNKNAMIPGCRFGGSGEEVYDTSGTSASYFIEVEPSTQYAMNFGVDWAQVVCFYDSSKTFIQRINSGGVRTFTTTSTTKYIRVSVYDTNLATAQLEKGSSASTYTPYQDLDNTGAILFEGAINGANITLTDSVSNYSYIEIYYGTAYDGKGQYIRKIQSNTSTFVLELFEIDSNVQYNPGLVISTNKFSMSNNTITFLASDRVYKYLIDTNWANDMNNSIIISKVVGYKN